MKKIFKQRLRELREENKWSQQELADKIGLSQSAITDWERGARSPNLAKTEKLADIFGVTVDYLLGRANKKGIAYTLDEIKKLHPDLAAPLEKVKKKMGGLGHIMWDQEIPEEEFWEWVREASKKLSK
jgi:transcriptional regulator with XRE-family HTH domain